MRTTGRILAATAMVGGSLLIAAPASAQTATPTPCGYPFANCVTPPPTTPPTTVPPTTAPPVVPSPSTSPIGGGNGGPGTGETPAPAPGEGVTGGGGGGGTAPVSNNSPVVQGSSGGAAGLPFTGGEVTLVALTGLAALGGGAVLIAAGRKRAQA